MQTLYLLQNCNKCMQLLNTLKKNPSRLINIIIVAKNDQDVLKKDTRIKTFPFFINGLPTFSGLPPRNVIIRHLKTPPPPKKPKPKKIQPKNPRFTIRKVKTSDGYELILEKKTI